MTGRPPRDGLLAMAVPVTRHCVHCGHAYETTGGSSRLVCSPTCNAKRWRAIGMLAGTHGYVDGKFCRLERELE